MVTYNRCNTLLKSISAINRLSRVPDYFIIVNNGSTDNTNEALKNYKSISLVDLRENLGYAGGLAAGMSYAIKYLDKFEYFWLMDDDTQPKPNALTEILNIKATVGKGIVSATGFIDTIWKGPLNISKFSKRAYRQVRPNSEIYHVDHVLIDGALIDVEVVEEIGMPNGKFFMMCEDVEYSKRIRASNYQVIAFPGEVLMDRLHFGGGSRFSKSTLWRGYYGARNHLLILKDYWTLRNVISYIIRQTKYLIAAFFAPDRFTRIYYRLLGIWHGIKGVTGRTIDPKLFS